MRIAVVGSGRSVHAIARSVAVAGLGHEVRFVTVGDVLPAPGVEMKLVPSGAKLELRVRGPNITPGYWKRPDLTAARRALGLPGREHSVVPYTRVGV